MEYFLMLIILITIISVSYITLLDRKLMSTYQRRLGSNIYGIYGIMQPLLDGIKLILKRNILPLNSIIESYLLGILLFLVISFILALLLPNMVYINKEGIIKSDISILVYIWLSSLNIYSILLGGYSSINVYSLLGSLRTISQLISYEIYITILIISIILVNKSYNINETIWLNVRSKTLLWLVLIVYIISFIGETNRPPFDIGESESELVSGINTEYSSYMFSIYIIGEYVNVVFLSKLISILLYNKYIFINNLNFSITTLLKSNSFRRIKLSSFLFFNFNQIKKPIFNNLNITLSKSKPIYKIMIKIILKLKISSILIGYLLNIFLIVILRGVYVRIRQDTILKLGWYYILPLTLIYIMILLMIISSFSI